MPSPPAAALRCLQARYIMNIALLISLLVCHYLADFCLTLPVMIRAKADGRTLWPILLHAGAHAVLMGGCLALWGTGYQLLTALVATELGSHFAIDVAKGRLTHRFGVLADQQQRAYWMVYGLDQLLHVLVVVLIWQAATR